MSDDGDQQREILVGETDDGDDLYLPVVELLTGRGFVTGKSGSGKSNTASVIAEELLEAGFPLLIVDTDGEYYGLKEEYEMLHAGADEECDIQIGPEHAEQMAELALEENVPIILDVSGYLDEDVADELLRKIARQLFVKEKKLKKPFLLVVEEVHEYIPEGGGVGETGNLLIKISKRGRKHGLGILGISQRPADVKKDFITQANWLVWHRLTWNNDTKVVGRIIDTEYSELVSDLNDGQAFVQTDWTDVEVRKVQFRRKRTFDAGATPGLDDFERPDLKSVSDSLVGDLEKISERKEREQDRINELENELEKKEKRIETLEDELESARDVSSAARQMADALTRPETFQTQLPDESAAGAGAGPGSEDVRQLHEEIVDLETERDELEEKLADREDRIEKLELQVESRADAMERLREENERLRERVRRLKERLDSGSGSGSDPVPDPDTGSATDSESAAEADDAIVQAGGDPVEFGYTDPGSAPDGESAETDIRTAGAESAGATAGSGGDDGTAVDGDSGLVVATDQESLADRLASTPLGERLEAASERSQCSVETAGQVLGVLARDEPLETEAIAERVERSPVAVQGLLSELRTESVLDRRDERSYLLEDDVRSTLLSVEND
ncbi:hypothetical protein CHINAEXTREME_16470 [Halobiforma lacisalsi AJ5]|uniref:Helicase HerA central domain-containing protein n=1 Tax=Natronobacterium lacisalsi AJ5 TaxID=358396 RepID=M0LEH8_NATLA|nr:DUF87 domain-containing protein [Halobiforma lacisalsi]APW99268.1 hypothetical protein CHINAEXTREME_16470 [Halobiforma lacisalsi AJ5]EMA30839.1 hypothetical protein C445_16071 [Halobiforma lacisalsi AJ5]